MNLTYRDWILVTLAAIGATLLTALLCFLAPGWFVAGSVFAGVAGVGILVFEVYRRLLGATEKAADGPNQTYRQLEALISLHRLIDLQSPLPALRGAAVAPDFALTLAELILELRPRRVLELGSGASTVIVAAMLRKIPNATLLSMEQDAMYAGQSHQQLIRNGLHDIARVIHAPIVPVSIDGTVWRWYDLASLPESRDVDLLIVDGPQQVKGITELIRYPALPLLYGLLGPRAVLVIDDADRDEERRTISRWKSEFNDFRVERRSSEKGTVIMRRQARPVSAD